MSKEVLVRAMAVAIILCGFRADRARAESVTSRTIADAAPPHRFEVHPPALRYASIRSGRSYPTCTDFETRAPLRGQIDVDVIDLAKHQLDLPMGVGRPLYVKGRHYLFCLEPHYHPPGATRGPVGWHKGVTVYEIS